MILASIPSPSTSVWHLGPLPLRAYALCIIAGVIAAIIISDRRLQARGGPKGAMMDVAVYAVPFGIVGARIYHVITTPEPYFGAGGQILDALKIWEGGLGIWGAISGGALGAWIACRRLGLPLRVVADAAAPGLLVAQAIGRLGNWFNNELYGRATTLPWGLEVHVMDPDTGRAVEENGEAVLRDGLYHPTFLYEALWCLAAAAVLVWVDKRFQLGRGRVFALYVMMYTAGRIWIEYLRIDEANRILGLRLNIWTCVIVFAGGLWYFLTHRGPRERLVVEDGNVRVIDPLETAEAGAAPAAAAAGAGAATGAAASSAVAPSEEAAEPDAVPPSEDPVEPDAVPPSEEAVEPDAVPPSEDPVEPDAVPPSEDAEEPAADPTSKDAAEPAGDEPTPADKAPETGSAPAEAEPADEPSSAAVEKRPPPPAAATPDPAPAADGEDVDNPAVDKGVR